MLIAPHTLSLPQRLLGISGIGKNYVVPRTLSPLSFFVLLFRPQAASAKERAAYLLIAIINSLSFVLSSQEFSFALLVFHLPKAVGNVLSRTGAIL